MTTRLYAQIAGAALLLLGVVGFMAGNYVFGLNSSVFEDTIHVILGAIGLYTGFMRDEQPARLYTQWSAPLYALIFLAGVISPSLFGLVTPPLQTQDNVVHVILGLLAGLAGYATTYRTILRGA